MKAYEILNEYSDTASGIRRALEAKGYKFLGQGVDQSAYLEPNTGYVLKIFGTQGNKLSDDHKMFYFWSKFCEKNASNPYLPKFYGSAEFMFQGNKYIQFRQEHLLKNPKFTERITQGLVAAVEYDDSFKEWKRKIEGYSGDNTWSPGGEKQFYKKTASFFGDEEQTQQLKEFYKTVEALYKISKKKQWGFDCHEGNIMMRADTTPVISDPWVV